jgi:hypothetical protein
MPCAALPALTRRASAPHRVSKLRAYVDYGLPAVDRDAGFLSERAADVVVSAPSERAAARQESALGVFPPARDHVEERAVSSGSVLVAEADVASTLEGLRPFADSPLILLVPIFAGCLVASGIIYVLVKSAG